MPTGPILRQWHLPHVAKHAASPSRAARRKLPVHLERVANRLTLLRGDQRNDAGIEAALACAALRDGRAARAARQARGSARAALIARLEALDDELLSLARASLGAGAASQALSAKLSTRWRRSASGCRPSAYETAREAVALTRLVREQAAAAHHPVRCGDR